MRSSDDDRQGKLRFDGDDYVPERDDPRLTNQFYRIKRLMMDGEWRSLGEIAEATGDPEASVSAQLRHLRKPRFGSYIVERRYEGEGLYRYRLLPGDYPGPSSNG